MAPYLEEHPNPYKRQYRARTEPASGVVVVHTTENIPDYVGFDGGAEAVANFIANRTTYGSYHDLVDSDSGINLVGYGNQAFHDATGTNPHSYGVSIATRADIWPLTPDKWKEGALWQAAKAVTRYRKWLLRERRIDIPASRITVEQARARVPGFISHGELDPGRRHDPGKDFPWGEFLASYTYLNTNKPPQEDDHMDEEDLTKIGVIVKKVVNAELEELLPYAVRIDQNSAPGMPTGSIWIVTTNTRRRPGYWDERKQEWNSDAGRDELNYMYYVGELRSPKGGPGNEPLVPAAAIQRRENLSPKSK